MRELQPYKLVTAQKRLERICKMITMFQNDKVLEQWGVEVDSQMTKIDGKKLEPPKIEDRNRFVDFKAF
jgi:glucose-6-phosphate isomerase